MNKKWHLSYLTKNFREDFNLFNYQFEYRGQRFSSWHWYLLHCHFIIILRLNITITIIILRFTYEWILWPFYTLQVLLASLCKEKSFWIAKYTLCPNPFSCLYISTILSQQFRSTAILIIFSIPQYRRHCQSGRWIPYHCGFEPFSQISSIMWIPEIKSLVGSCALWRWTCNQTCWNHPWKFWKCVSYMSYMSYMSNMSYMSYF